MKENKHLNMTGEEKKNETLEVIVEFMLKNGYPPTVKEISQLTGVKSTSHVWERLRKMKEDGTIELGRFHSQRTIRVKGVRYIDERVKNTSYDKFEIDNGLIDDANLSKENET